MAGIVINVNRKRREIVADPATPLLWVLRDHLGLTGSKYGCGIGMCGACSVFVDGTLVRSCSLRVGDVGRRRVTTIEGLGDRRVVRAVREAWVEEQVPQCGYCQGGQIMGTVALLLGTPEPTDADIDAALAGHLCRCGTYARIRRAVHRAAAAAKRR